MLERRFLPNFLFIFLALIACISIWQIIDGPGPPPPDILQENSVAVYSLITANTSSFVYPTSTLPATDYTRLIDLTDFKYDILNIICNETSPILLVIIQTAPRNIEKRKVIRETWGSQRDNMKIIFMLGKVDDPKLQRALERENRKHRDFAQGNFIDAYRNMTYKHIMAFKYAIYHCPQAKYVLKTDDDVFVNMPTLMDFLTVELSPYGANKLLLCTPFINSPVLRTYRSKWRVSFSEFSSRYYPPYCPGWALLYSADVVFDLYREAQKTKYFWIDDVHITGTLAKQAHIVHTSIDSLVLPRENISEIVNQSGTYNSSKIFLYGQPDLSLKQIRLLWKFVRDPASYKYKLKNHR